MTNFRFRLLSHLSYANAMASIAVFVALGGVGYAATSINGNDIAKRTVGANKLKNGTLTSKQVKANALNGSVIDEASLSIVPSAQTAVSATTAGSATSAGSATTATTAASASNAANAEHALTADHATEATTAASAATAADADTVGGLTAEELQVTCPAETDLFGGMCWDVVPRPADDWFQASIECADEGGRLPSLSELLAYVAQAGVQFAGPGWSSDFTDGDGSEELVIASDETVRSHPKPIVSLGYRCLFYRTN
jgi:hypothetical protein